MGTNAFMDDCVRINKPCKFEGLAKNWVAYEKWRLVNGGPKYLEGKLKESVVAYMDMNPEDMEPGYV